MNYTFVMGEIEERAHRKNYRERGVSINKLNKRIVPPK